MGYRKNSTLRVTAPRARATWLAVMAGMALAPGYGCSSSDEERRRAAEISEGCSINSDCSYPLICAFTRCHKWCDTDHDCTAPQRCVISDGDRNVCQLPDDRDCRRDDDCRAGLVCAVDDQCRNPCEADGACVPGQHCTSSGHCASVVLDVLDVAGNLVPASSEGSGGSSGAGASSSTGGAPPTQAGGSGNASGGTMNGGTGGGASGSSGAAGSDGVGGSAGMPGSGGLAGASGTSPVSLEGAEPNENRDQPQVLPLHAEVRASFADGADVDYYEVTAPSAAGGGYFQFSVTDVGAGNVTFTALSTVNHGEIYSHGTSGAGIGSSLFSYLAAAPGQSYHLALEGSQAPEFGYVLGVSYTAIDDPYEPNDTRDGAAPIALGEPVHAYFFAGRVSSPLTGTHAFQDVYAVELEPGEFHITLDDVPLTIDVDLRVYNPSGGPIAQSLAADYGESLEVTGTTTDSGTHYIQLTPSHAGATAAAVSVPGEVPDHFTRRYTLTVSQ